MKNINEGIYFITETADGYLSNVHVDTVAELLDDWNGDCDLCPANDAQIFFAAIDGQPVNPYQYTDFESLIVLLQELQKADDQCAEHQKISDDDGLIPAYQRDPVWIKFNEKWGDAVEVDQMDYETSEEYMSDLYDAYESSGFVPFLKSSRYDKEHDGEKFTVISRVNTDDPDWDYESLPAWRIMFEDGTEYYAFPEEICFCEIFLYCEKEVLPVLGLPLNSTVLKDEYIGKTVMDLMLTLDDGVVTDLETLNIALDALSLQQIDLVNMYLVTDIKYDLDFCHQNPELPDEMLVHVAPEDGDLYSVIDDYIFDQTGYKTKDFVVRNLAD